MIRKTLLLAALNLTGVLFAFQASANDMINNSAIGIVTGSITQIAEDGTTNVVDVGSIVGDTANNVKVSAVVRGDIFVHTKGNHGGTVVKIGSVEGK